MKISNVAIILPYDEQGKILFQDRRKISKHGEEYGFFGGHIENNETPEDALKRELKEELEINTDDLENLEFFKQFNNYVKEWDKKIKRSTYLAKIPELNNLKIHEGKAIVIDIEKSFNLKMNPGDSELLKEIYKYLKSKKYLKNHS
ncbi:MAG: NUDIX domain-containing protein [Nanoarchaeota archaeon]|nr:NUDIX domain-containing protein [Nanoarchaeota archaeon]MBU1028228.1 NUDIX domain-containing protein [Nanoarchaeota archaeon]